MQYRNLWIGFAAVFLGSFAVLGYYGSEIYRQAPPIPDQVLTESGRVLFTGQDIKYGQNVWQSTGGQQLGSIWGHGAYEAPGWTADWLHKEALLILDTWAKTLNTPSYEQLQAEEKARLQTRLQTFIRKNTYDFNMRQLTIPDLRAKAITHVGRHYTGLFSNDSTLAAYREAYAVPANSI